MSYWKENPFGCWSESCYTHHGQVQCEGIDETPSMVIPCQSRYMTGICVFCGEWFCWRHLEKHLYTLYVGHHNLIMGSCGNQLFRKERVSGTHTGADQA